MNKSKIKRQKVVFLFDVDNTLLNNDQVTRDLQKHLSREVGPIGAKHYWTLFEQLRRELVDWERIGFRLQEIRNELDALERGQGAAGGGHASRQHSDGRVQQQ